MSTGFGFCPTCGTPRTAAEQKFCAVCGFSFAGAPPMPPAPPVAAPVQPEPPAGAPTAPPPWATPGAAAAQTASQGVPSYPPPYLGAPAPPVPVAPAATSAGHKSRRPLLVLGGLVLAAIVGVFVYMNLRSTLTNGGSTSGGITFTPSSFSCSSALGLNPVTVTARLTSFMTSKDVNQQDTWQWQLDGAPVNIGTNVLTTPRFIPLTDGSWRATGTTIASWICTDESNQVRSMGAHTMRVLDASGKVLTEGSFTLTP